MKKLLITLLLISPFSFADWGDVYYCQMTNSLGISLEGKRTNYALEKFQFKLDKTKNAMVFGKSGIFKGSEMYLREGMSFPESELWYVFHDRYGMSYFNEGKFVYSMVTIGISSIAADCEKF